MKIIEREECFLVVQKIQRVELVKESYGVSILSDHQKVFMFDDKDEARAFYVYVRRAVTGEDELLQTDDRKEESAI